jgi:hypothetical protein
VQVSGKPSSAKGKVTLAFKTPGSLTCPKAQKTTLPVVSLVNAGYSPKTKLKLTVTLRRTSATGTAQLCYRAPKPFKSQSPATSKPTGGAGLLLTCAATNNVAPCVLSSKTVNNNIVVVYYAPGGDPLSSVTWVADVKTVHATGTGTGLVGQPFKDGLVVTGGKAPYFWSAKGDAARLQQAGVTFSSKTGKFSGMPTAAGKYKLTMTVKDSSRTPLKKQFVSVITIVAPSG